MHGYVAFSGADDSFILGTPSSSTNLHTIPKAGYFLHVAMFVPIAKTSISHLSLSISINLSSYRSSLATIVKGVSGTCLVHNYLHSFDKVDRSPESRRTAIFVTPHSINALPSMIVFRIPDYNVEYVSINVVKLSGNARAKFKNEAS